MYLFWEDCGVRSPGRFEVSFRRLGFAINLIGERDYDSDWPWIFHLHLLWMNLFIHIPFRAYRGSVDDFHRAQWGFTCTDMGPHLHFGSRTKVLDWPWSPKFQRHEVLRADGSWVPFVGCWEHDKQPDGRKVEEFSYHYLLRNWNVQKVKASVHIERRSYRPKWLQWTSLFEKRRPSISVEFSDEIGERTGSWKGGCIGCGYTLRKDETAEQCLRRMERERKFN